MYLLLHFTATSAIARWFFFILPPFYYQPHNNNNNFNMALSLTASYYTKTTIFELVLHTHCIRCYANLLCVEYNAHGCCHSTCILYIRIYLLNLR